MAGIRERFLRLRVHMREGDRVLQGGVVDHEHIEPSVRYRLVTFQRGASGEDVAVVPVARVREGVLALES